MKRIVVSRRALIAGDPCYLVDDKPMRGFECRGVVFVKTEQGRAWMEFHGDDDRLMEGGMVIEPGSDAIEVGPWGLNLWPAGALRRLRENETLKYVAVNRTRVRDRHTTAVTAYTYPDGGAAWEQVRLEGTVRSVTVIPPITTPGEPLNAWVETTGRIEAR